jgi:hypothetical protein
MESAPELASRPASSSKQAARATPKGSLRLLCAGDTENSKQPVFYVEPKFGGGTVHIYLQRTVFGMYRISSLRSDILGALALYPKI